MDPIVQSQTPAKLTDAIATGTAVLATAVPPVLDLLEGGKIVAVSDRNLVEALAGALSGQDADAAGMRRAFFRAELSSEVNAQRAGDAIAAAQRKNGPVPSDVRRLFEHIDGFMPGSLPRECLAATKGAFRAGPRVGPLRTLREGVNLGLSSGSRTTSSIYGRRQDMLLKQFAAMPQIARILHISTRRSPPTRSMRSRPRGARPCRQGSAAANTVGRFLGASDDERVARRTFVYRGKETHLLGRELPSIEEFPNAVETWARRARHGRERAGLGLSGGARLSRGAKAPRLLLRRCRCDRRPAPMADAAAWRMQIEKNYRDTFAAADAAFANCAPVAAWLEGEGLKPAVVHNGMDVRLDAGTWEIPARLKTPAAPDRRLLRLALASQSTGICSKRSRWRGRSGRSC